MRRNILKSRPHPESGLMEMVPTWEEYQIVQGFLTAEEAAKLPADVKWEKHDIKGHGNYVCKYGGRRFFVEELPSKTVSGPPADDDSVPPVTSATPPKRKRGRPRKNPR